jgi:hypothetical protein
MADEAGDGYAERLNLALMGLTPIVWIERCSQRCRDPRRPTRGELWPDDAEREAALEKLVMADGLAIGQPSARPGSLTALAKALVMLSVVEGGVKFNGVRYYVEDVEGGGVIFRSERA